MSKFLPAAAAVAAVTVLAACHPGTSASSPASSASAARAVASAAPKAPASATVTPKQACQALAAWENGDSSETLGRNTSLQNTFADTDGQLSGDFAVWVSEVKTGSLDVGTAAGQVASDCAAYGVTIFSSATASPPAVPATSAPSLEGKVVATFSGSGIENTAKFTVTDTWKLDYSFDCSGFGGSGNFIVNEDGGSDLGGASVNELGPGKSGSTYAYGDAGTHYLEINSECSWDVKVTDEG